MGTEMSTSTGAVQTRAVASESTRWGQLIFGIICMVMIANLQYGWTLFVNPIDQKYHWGRAAIQVAFTIFVLTETWLVPFEGYLIDKFGPRVMICGSGALVAIAWMINAYADSLALLYLAAAIGGIGAGVIYGGSVGNALKWFPDRRGLAAGLTGAGGPMATAQLSPIANDYKIAGVPVSILGLPPPALTFALTIDRVLNGICRPFFGWVSDHIGRENTMFIAFFVEGVGIYALLYFANNPVLFVILSGLVFFAWGEIYSLFPATCTDIYGRKFATTNYGMLYTAKGTASLLAPLANVLTSATGSWHAVFYVAAILNIVAAVMALLVLRPMRQRAMERG